MTKYNFYFDESSHNYRITNKTIIQNINYSDSYVGIFVGIPQILEVTLLSQFNTFEDYYKKIFSTRGELKGSNIKNIKVQEPRKYFSSEETFKNGIASFDENVTQFYIDFFSLFTDEVIIHLSTISKFEQNFLSWINIDKLQNILRSDIKIILSGQDPYKIVEVYLYSLIKIFYVYRNSETFEKIYDSKVPKEEKLDTLNNLLNEISILGEDVERKQHEAVVIDLLRKILDKDILNDDFDNKFNHKLVLDGFINLLEELDILASDIDMFPDKDSGIKFDDIGFHNLKEQDSKKTKEIRIADIFSNFVYRLMLALRRATDERWGTQEAIKNFSVIKTLPKVWFDLDERQFLLYLNISKIFESRKRIYWTTYSGIYFDEVIQFFTIINYFNNYDNFESYSNLSLNEHREKFHEFEMIYLTESYERREW